MMRLMSVYPMALAGAGVFAAALSAGGPPQQSAPGSGPNDLKVGDKAPPFELQGSDGTLHRLSDYKGNTVVLAWFPKAFTGG